MPTPKECRQNAEDCLRLAREATTIYAREALLELAAEFREIAEQLSDPQSRRTMLRIAEDYERLAAHAKGLRLLSVPYESCSAGNIFALRLFFVCHWEAQNGTEPPPMHGLIYLIGLIVVILFILSFFGLR